MKEQQLCCWLDMEIYTPKNNLLKTDPFSHMEIMLVKKSDLTRVRFNLLIYMKKKSFKAYSLVYLN